jgi:hypothetical protein
VSSADYVVDRVPVKVQTCRNGIARHAMSIHGDDAKFLFIRDLPASIVPLSITVRHVVTVVRNQFLFAVDLLASIAALPIAIMHVVSVARKEEMCRIAAWRPVACVTHALTVWNGSACQFVCDAMRLVNLCCSSLSCDAEHSVAETIARRSPRPTFGRRALVNLRPEAGADVLHSHLFYERFR